MRYLAMLPGILLGINSYANQLPPAEPEPQGPNRTGFYLGGGLGSHSEDATNELGMRASFSSAALVGLGGYHFTHWFGLESVFSVSTDAGAASTLSLTPKFTFQVSDSVNLYVKGGISLVVTTEDDSSSSHCDGWSNGGNGSDGDVDDDDIDLDDIFDMLDVSVANRSRQSGKYARSHEDDSCRETSGVGGSFGAGANIQLARSLHLRLGVEFASATTHDEDDTFDIEHDITSAYGAVYYQF